MCSHSCSYNETLRVHKEDTDFRVYKIENKSVNLHPIICYDLCGM